MAQLRSDFSRYPSEVLGRLIVTLGVALVTTYRSAAEMLPSAGHILCLLELLFHVNKEQNLLPSTAFYNEPLALCINFKDEYRVRDAQLLSAALDIFPLSALSLVCSSLSVRE
eukprot:m.545337 g.545337  ORF g.545337 m.545337 type:complete len:113 (-) comp57670_c0_seq62:4525-4863(-)